MELDKYRLKAPLLAVMSVANKAKGVWGLVKPRSRTYLIQSDKNTKSNNIKLN